MSSGQSQNPSAALQGYIGVWSESISRVLGQLHGSPFAASDAAFVSAYDRSRESGGSIVLTCRASGATEGEHAIRLSTADAVKISHLLMSEPIDSGGELDDGRKDALLEAFRQFSGVAATAAKAAYGAPVTFEMQLSGVLDWTPASAATISFRAPSVEPVAIQFLLSERIVAALEQARDRAAAANAGAATRPAEAPGATASSVTPKSAGEPNQPNNLNLLLDVTLDAHLRFGQREMLLRDILELRAGSVVELDRRLQEPAELLVSGRVVARGDVVIVDGSYGIRIRDIVQPRERLESVKT